MLTEIRKQLLAQAEPGTVIGVSLNRKAPVPHVLCTFRRPGWRAEAPRGEVVVPFTPELERSGAFVHYVVNQAWTEWQKLLNERTELGK